MKKLIRKLKSRSGETIGEVLVALLISALALMMLAGAISTSSGLVTRSREKQAEYYKANDELTGGTAEGSSGTVTVSGKTYNVTYYINNKIGNIPVIAYTPSASGTPGGTGDLGSGSQDSGSSGDEGAADGTDGA